MHYHSTYLSPIGNILIRCDEKYVLRVEFISQYTYYQENGNHLTAQVRNWLDLYFAHQNPNPNSLPLFTCGSHFQKEVWECIKKTPYGEVTTYGKIAQEIAKSHPDSKMSAQAVGNAISKNPFVIVVPCHRIIGSDHSLVGYAGGVEKKEFLLRHEGHHIENHKLN